jgi:CYTH domain-containing protein
MPSQKRQDREIERKYLLTGRPERVAAARSVEVDQGYLPGERINERIRRVRDADGTVTYVRTLKSGSGLERIEIEEETTRDFFEAVWPTTRGARVRKRRYYVPDGQVTWEIDEFLDRPDLWLAEVELDSVEQEVEIPGWLAPSVVREVTLESEYTNHALAK